MYKQSLYSHLTVFVTICLPKSNQNVYWI